MKTIMVISPEYLHAVYGEVKKYSFHLQGYGCFKAACKGILRINCAELLGIAYLGDTIPSPGSIEQKKMFQFLHMVDLLEDSKKMIFVCNGSLLSLKEVARKCEKIRIAYSPIEGAVTDSLINKTVFGSILMDVKKPYYLMQEKEERNVKIEDYLLHYTPAMNGVTLECLEPIIKLADIHLTLENDRVFQAYVAAENTLLSLIRKRKILHLFHETDVRIDGIIKKMMDDLSNVEIWCVYKTLNEMEVKSLNV